MEDINEYRMARARDYWLSNADDSDYQYIDNILRGYEAIRREYAWGSSEHLNEHRLNLQRYLQKNSECIAPHLVIDWRRKARWLESFLSEMTGSEMFYVGGIWDDEQVYLAGEVLRQIKKNTKDLIDISAMID